MASDEAADLPLLRACTQLGVAVFGAVACSIAVLEPDEEHLVFRAASGEGAEAVVGLRLPVGRGIAGWAVSSGQAIAVEDVRRDPRFARDVAESTGYVPDSLLAMPLPGGVEGLGVVEVLDRTRVEGRDDLAILALLAQQASLAIELAAERDAARALAASPAAVALAGLAAAGEQELATATGLLQALVTYVEGQRGHTGLV